MLNTTSPRPCSSAPDQVAVEALAVLEQQVAGRGAHLTSPWTCLNSSPPARPSISNRAVSTRGGHRAQRRPSAAGRPRGPGPSASRRRPRPRAPRPRRPAARPRSGSTHTWVSIPQISTWSRPPRSKPSAEAPENTVLGSGSTSPRWSADLVDRGAQALRVLLGDHHRQAHDLGGLHQRRRRRLATSSKCSTPLRKASWTSTTSTVGPVALQHQLTAPIANERSRKATAPAATVIRTRPVSVRPWKAQLAERLS